MHPVLKELGLQEINSGACGATWIDDPSGPEITSYNPATGEALGKVKQASAEDYEKIMTDAQKAFESWRHVPAPQRGEIVRQLGDALRKHKAALGALVSLEMGKIRAEGEGEVQEMIDICDFAVGLSRQLYGKSMHSERPGHRMYEQWHPMGIVGIISAFNFPVAVWNWNSAIAAVCGDSMVWKPSPITPLVSVATQKIAYDVLKANGHEGVMCMALGEVEEVGERMLRDKRIPVVSATGSCRMGRRVAEVVSSRFGRTILELGGNNAMVILDDADLELATRGILFSAVGTAGQRCTSARRIIAQKGIVGELTERLVKAYASVPIGDPLDEKTLMGPLVNQRAVDDMMAALEKVKEQGGEILCGGNRLDRPGYFVEPTIVKAHPDMDIVQEETFAPILYILEFDELEDAIGIQNNVPQGLSSAIFTKDILSAEAFLSAGGSDCGIANVNIGTSGAEIGGAFGGEKETGGGREAGSDSWKQYMRRQTCTINWSKELPLAQGINFG